MDGSVQRAHLEAQYELYDHLSSRMAAHARATERFYGVVKHGGYATLYYTGRYTVKSGAQDTSSGQTTRRLDLLVRCFVHFGVSELRGFVFGDDVWLLVTGGDLPSVEAVRLEQCRAGWKTKGVYVANVESSEFLASVFVPDVAGGYAMVPKPGRLLAKLFWTVRNVPPRRRASYIKQVAESFLDRYTGFHFMECWLGWHMSGIQHKHDQQFTMPLTNKPVVPRHPHALAWQEFLHLRYGVGFPPRSSFDKIIGCNKHSVHILHDPWVEELMRYDLSDPAERCPEQYNY
jgi:hypothetical protein